MPITLDDLELIYAIRTEHEVQTRAFDCTDDDLNDFVRNDCYRYQEQWLSHTRLARYKKTGNFVGFITLLSDSIVLETGEKKRLFDFHKKVVQFPGLKIARLGVHKEVQRQGVGAALLTYAIGVAFRINNELGVGCRFLTVDAYPQSVSWYQRHGFVFNEAGKKRTNRSMRYDLLRTAR
jgi:ribosomal protein S18 acetylase RimI-like enzyme